MRSTENNETFQYANYVSSKKHKPYGVEDILESLKTKKESIQRDLQELEKANFPTYQTSAKTSQFWKLRN